MTPSDTIAAIATAPGEGGVSIVRVSGPAALRIADAVFQCGPPLPSHRAAFTFVPGRVLEVDGSPLDEALLLIFRAPHSYTREDVVEIQGHGGPIVARRILRRVLDAGARAAEPGEFTRRAFLNGRIDLLQAEAVLDLIRARCDRAAAAAVEQLQGRLSVRFGDLYDRLVVAAASVEASLDFPDEELPATILDGLADAIRTVRSDMADLLATWTEGHLLRDGATLVIAGRPNVGKSTLLNALLGKDRAIVSPHPGTTRDFIEEGMVIGGYPVRIVDTAGLRASDCDIEREGIRRTSDQIARADLILHVMDASQDVCDKHESLINESRETPVLVVYNKVDIAAEDYRKRAGADVGGLAVSALRGDGIHELRQWIVRKLDGHGPRAMQHAAISERHRKLLAEASARVDEALDLLSSEEHRDADLAANALREALGSLGLVTGREYHKELLDNIFGRFCIGK